MSVVVVVVVVVVVAISASYAGHGVRSFFAKLFSLNKFFGKLIVFRHLNMDFTIILEYTFSQLILCFYPETERKCTLK